MSDIERVALIPTDVSLCYSFDNLVHLFIKLCFDIELIQCEAQFESHFRVVCQLARIQVESPLPWHCHGVFYDRGSNILFELAKTSQSIPNKGTVDRPQHLVVPFTGLYEIHHFIAFLPKCSPQSLSHFLIKFFLVQFHKYYSVSSRSNDCSKKYKCCFIQTNNLSFNKIKMQRSASSYTRFRQLSAPRIRSAARLDDSPDRHRNFSATNIHKFNPGPNNPQNARPQTALTPKKPQLAKLSSAEYTRDTFRAAESPVKKMADNPPPVTRKQLQYGKEYGRKLEYPVNRPEQRIPKTLEESPEKRPFSSPHFASRSTKSMRIKAEREEYQHKFQKALDYLLETNPDVIKERQRLCCQKAKPFKTFWNIPQAGVLSTYKDHYPPKWAQFDQSFEPQNKKQAFGLPDGNVPKNSTYRDHYEGKYGDPADIAEFPEGFKLQGPLPDTTTYMNHYPNYGNYEKMVPIAVWDKAPTGMPFAGNSNHRISYKDPQGAPPANLATWNNLHPYGNDFDPNRGTTYQQHHGPKERQPIQDFKIPYEEILKNPGKYGTEYKDEFPDKTKWAVNKSNKCPC